MATEDMAKITNELIAEKNATIDKIYNLKDNEQIKVMVLRYSEGMTWDEVSQEIGLSRRKVFKVHKQAMAKLNN
ncbi:sigma factor-like helix-turn-helix DNA-binding protein [uncultured Streptococcus sp.]|uniref:sigma factor-like helix-turn-helix DNA-binding protein n=1 Tax=uncultured Streptococcus sp. TaxID=83427 RepID=UPI00258F93CD|nr:sigma factor-like helix-turn-helix DNA-binding protein [uncultured Streptococcus sp.]